MKLYFLCVVLLVGVAWLTGLKEKYKISDFMNYFGLYLFLVIPFAGWYALTFHFYEHDYFAKSMVLPLGLGIGFWGVSIGCLFGFSKSINKKVFPIVAYMETSRGLQWAIFATGTALLIFQFIYDYNRILDS